MRKAKRVLAFHFDEGRSGRAIAIHCGLARRSVALVLERFAASGLSWPEARDLDDEALEAALYPVPREALAEDVDWARVEKDLSGRGMTLKLLWQEWRETHPEGMSYVTWCRRFRHWRPRRDVTMRQNRRPGERLFVDYAGMTVPLLIDRVAREAQVFIASMGVSGRLYAEATLSQKIDDWCASHVRCFENMGRAPRVVVPDNVKAAVKQPSRYEPVLNETYADLLEHYGVEGFPARVRKPRDKALVENGVLHGERWILAPLRNHVFHDLASLNRAIAAQVEKINARPYADGTGENRRERFESVDLPHMKPLPTRRWQRTLWRQNTVHPDYHIAIERHFYSVPHEYVGKEVDVRLRGSGDRRLPPRPPDRQPSAQRCEGPRQHGRGAPAGGASARRRRGDPRPAGAARPRSRAPRPRLRRRADGAPEQSGIRLPVLLRRSPLWPAITRRNASTAPAATRWSSAPGPIAASTTSCAPAPISPTPERSPSPHRSIIPTSEERSTTNDRNRIVPPGGRTPRHAAPARHEGRLPRADGAPRPRRHAVRGSARPADRPRGRRPPLQSPAAAPQEGQAAPPGCLLRGNQSEPAPRPRPIRRARPRRLRVDPQRRPDPDYRPVRHRQELDLLRPRPQGLPRRAARRSICACRGCSTICASPMARAPSPSSTETSPASTFWSSTTGAWRPSNPRAAAISSKSSTTASVAARSSSPPSCRSSDWHRQLKDPSLADAILDRLVHGATRFELHGASMRIDDAGAGTEP